MKYLLNCIVIAILSSVSLYSLAQSSGYINRQATSPTGRSILDPDLNGYTSITSSGFGTDDVVNSEIPYKIVKSYAIEPYGDLRRGPDHNYSDFVPDSAYNGFYYYFNGTQMLYRFRLGSIMPGSKGYSVLLDTDGKFGASGANADPNYVAATTGVNGNPGFEIEIVLETNFRIAIYNIDGTSNPTLIKAYTNWQDMSQVSVAATNDNGDPDFFMDFYIPFSDVQAAPFNLTTSTSLRMISTTVMSPQAAIGGPKSDIYGLNDELYSSTNQEYEDFINGQPGFTLGGTGIGPMCTAAPILLSPILTGTVDINGTWTMSTLSGAQGITTIKVYKNGVLIGTIPSVTSESSWTLSSVSVSANDTIIAKAQSTGESMCLSSNAVIARSCNAANTSTTSGAAFICYNSRRGFSGTRVSGAVVKLYTLAAAGNPVLFATDGSTTSPSGYNITYTDATHWEYNGSNNSGTADPCSGGPNDIPNGSYFFTVTESGKCESKPVFGGCVNLSATADPTITQTVLYDGTGMISGTATTGATVRLYQNGILYASATAAGGVYSFSNVVMTVGDIMEVNAQASGNCVSNSITRTVKCYTATPALTKDANKQIAVGSYITGTSISPMGTTIKVYTSNALLVATTSVQSNGTWSTGNVGTTPAVYAAVADTSYFATATNGTCSISSNTDTCKAVNPTSSGRCGTITGAIASSATSISGTLTGSFTSTTVNLYLDGILIGSTSTNNASWGPIAVNTTINNTLYPNGVLSIGIQETGKQEVTCAASAVTISCSPAPTAPTVNPPTSTINLNQSVTYTISNAVSGSFYAMSDSATGQSLGQGKWAMSNGNLTLTSSAFSNTGSYVVVIKSTNVSGTTVCTSPAARTSVVVSGVLPIMVTALSGNRNLTDINLEWKTQHEPTISYFELQRSIDGRNFTSINTQTSKGRTAGKYDYVDHYESSATLYYRLKIVSQSGATSFSSVVVLNARNAYVKAAFVSPNPFKDALTLYVSLDKTEQVSVLLTDISGKEMLRKTYTASAGSNSFRLPLQSQLRAGMYLVHIKTSDAVYQQKLIKMND